ncbi:uncharacterized protein FIESC28_06361 [Fusarium coffeatum]|uniref:Uncharacterized protein n=1 Tax=Fusarium coffeatum TaxID=231269 RepID=A0A366RMD3_9HYPO|nr:uncharacterized protein FIESC28_06361 [Fusarium coffeatum]RBR17922.1 hypothetical protein FIESC28_06361 [Fusarium coffeatum]
MQDNQREREMQELHERLKETQEQMSDLRRLISRTHRHTLQELEDLRRIDELLTKYPFLPYLPVILVCILIVPVMVPSKDEVEERKRSTASQEEEET